MRISDWSSDVCSSDLRDTSPAAADHHCHGRGTTHLTSPPMTNSKPGKTLTLKKKAATPGAIDDGERRKRAGGRARQVAQQEREREKLRVAKAAALPNKPGNKIITPSVSKNSEPPQHDTAQPRTAVRRARRPAQAEIFPVFAPCPQGLEEALAAEMQALGFDDAEPARAGCRFHTDWTGILRANLYSRLATRILVQVAHAPVQHEDDILELARQTPWEHWFGAEQTQIGRA